MPKRKNAPGRKAVAGIAAAMQRQDPLRDEPLLEVACPPDIMPEDLLSEMARSFEGYAQDEQGVGRELQQAQQQVRQRQGAEGLRRSRRACESTYRRGGAEAAGAKRASGAGPSKQGEDEEGGGSEEDLSDDDEGGGEGAPSAEDAGAGGSARTQQWEQRAVECVAQAHRLARTGAMLPMAMQNMLVHIMVNNGMHLDASTSLKAFRTLQLLVQQAPPASAVEAGDGAPMQLRHHDMLWHPLQQEIRRSSLCDRLGAGFTMLQRLVSRQVDWAAGRQPAPVGANEPPLKGDAGGRAQGEALLLTYIVGLMQVDLAARLRVLRASPSSTRAPTLLSSSLLWRLLQDDIGSGSWGSAGAQGKGDLLRSLVLLAVTRGAHDPGCAPPEPPPTRHGESRPTRSARARSATPPPNAGGGGGGGGVASAPVAVGRAELAGVAAACLRCMLAMLGAAEEAGMFAELQRQRDVRNERMELDRVLLDTLTSTSALPELGSPGAKLRLLAILGPKNATRLLSLVAAGAYERLGCTTNRNASANLAALAVAVENGGKGVNGFVQGDTEAILKYLVDHRKWFAKSFFNGAQEGMALAGSCLGAAGCALAANTAAASAGAAPGRRKRPEAAGAAGRDQAAASVARSDADKAVAAGAQYASAEYGRLASNRAYKLLAAVHSGETGCRPGELSLDLALRLATLETQLRDV